MENKTFLKQAHVTGKWWDLNQETSSPGSSLWAHREDPQAEPAWSLACAPCSRLYSRETEALARLLSWWASLLLVNSLWRSHRWPRVSQAWFLDQQHQRHLLVTWTVWCGCGKGGTVHVSGTFQTSLPAVLFCGVCENPDLGLMGWQLKEADKLLSFFFLNLVTYPFRHSYVGGEGILFYLFLARHHVGS